ncbi:hypothetical protein P3W85_36560 [Cupriavidus basilensis]|uniref:Uncharacterized protein n=1 Tax=Cupriavidus basilensis TaxID=68895 RepID=A0ABT6B0L1_9BURK|nr:hypothetical protein [Cupriavidus basilensis]MDF3838405.1 hypothetical protein [Cupriavidus basilensis]
MDNKPSASYKGFDIYPLIYPHVGERIGTQPRRDRSFNASVVICREGEKPGTEQSRVFPSSTKPWENIGAARRAMLSFAQEIIDGTVPGQALDL